MLNQTQDATPAPAQNDDFTPRVLEGMEREMHVLNENLAATAFLADVLSRSAKSMLEQLGEAAESKVLNLKKYHEAKEALVEAIKAAENFKPVE